MHCKIQKIANKKTRLQLDRYDCKCRKKQERLYALEDDQKGQGLCL